MNGAFPLDDDFKIFSQNYSHLDTYSPILTLDNTDLQFSSCSNHVFFKTSSPFDFLTIKLFNDNSKEENKLIGFFEESFFKTPENTLILGYLYKN